MNNINSIPETILDDNNLIININGVFVKHIYKNIAYSEMKCIELVRGHVIKRWKFSFILGLLITIVFTLQIVKITPYIDPTTTISLRVQMATYISLFIFLSFGLYLLYLSLSKKPCIKIFTLDNRMYLYPLSNSRNELSNIVSFLETCNVNLINMLPPEEQNM